MSGNSRSSIFPNRNTLNSCSQTALRLFWVSLSPPEYQEGFLVIPVPLPHRWNTTYLVFPFLFPEWKGQSPNVSIFYLIKVSLRGIFCSYWFILDQISYFYCKNIQLVKKATFLEKKILFKHFQTTRIFSSISHSCPKLRECFLVFPVLVPNTGKAFLVFPFLPRNAKSDSRSCQSN